MDLNHLTATDLIQRIQSGEFSIQEVCEAHVNTILSLDEKIKAWEYFDKDLAMNYAKSLDENKKKQTLKKLFGIPIGIKDVFNTKDMPTSMGSPIWAGFTPGNDARVVHSIREQDGLIFGKTVTAEFAVHYLSANKTVNPHNYNHIPGTSSSGSAAAVASFMVPLSLGTQTAGSIIRPSSFCGVFGFKPTFGVIPRTGTLKTTDTLDSIGCMARSVQDIRLLFDTIRVRGIDYPIVKEKLSNYLPSISKKIKIGLVIDGIWVFDGYKKYALEAFEQFTDELKKESDLEIIKINPSKELNLIHDVHSRIYDKTLSYYFTLEFKQTDQISDIIRNLIENGNRISTEEYFEAIKQQAEIRSEVEKQLHEYDIILTLSTASEAPKIGENELPDTCLIWTFLGFPTLNIPIFKSSTGLPFGLQVIAKRYDDYKLLYVAEKYLTKNLQI